MVALLLKKMVRVSRIVRLSIGAVKLIPSSNSFSPNFFHVRRKIQTINPYENLLTRLEDYFRTGKTYLCRFHTTKT
jgi:hypothetical protein